MANELLDDGIMALNAIYFLICDAGAHLNKSDSLQIPADNLAKLLRLAIDPLEQAQRIFSEKD
jgi:hypothetical protein